MRIQAVYPTLEHERAARAIVDFFSAQADTDAVILMGSCARGKAVRDSCLDFLILLQPEVFTLAKDALERQWQEFYTSAQPFRALHQIGKFSHVDLDLIDGRFVPKPRSWTSGPDEFELEIGNTLVYAVALWQRSDYLDRLKAQWLPYYSEALRQQRLATVRDFCLNNLDHIPLFVARGLYLQSFNRLYDAFREFLQALFISRRTYPIAYDKWIREQVEEILGLPDLYQRLPRLLEISHFESDEIAWKAEELRGLLEDLYAESPYIETIYQNFASHVEELILQAAGVHPVPWEQGLLVEWVGGVDVNVDTPEVTDFGPTAASRLETINWGGHEIRVPPLDLQLQVSERRGLAERVEKIKRAMEDKGS